MPKNTECVAVRLSALGDAILTTGVLEYWHQTRNLSFHVVTRTALAPIFSNHPAVLSITGVEPHDARLRPWIKFCQSLAARFGQLPLIDLHANLRTSLLRLLWSGPVHGYAKFSLTRRLFLATRHSFFSRRLRSFNVPQRYSLALETIAPHPAQVRPVLFLTEEEKKYASSMLEARNLRRPIAIHPFATHPAKTPVPQVWKNFVQILRQNGHDVVIIGRAPEALLPDQNFDLTGATDLRQTAAIIAASKCLVSGDSGPLHLGTAVGTPCVGLFGPTTREWGFYPSGPKDTVYQNPCPDAPCSLHGQDSCARQHACMQSNVLDPILNLLQELAPPG